MSDSNGGCLPLIIIGIGAWAYFGEPSQSIANMFWSDTSAPWEDVIGFYYPNAKNMNNVKKGGPFDSVDDCRVWIENQAALHNDPEIARGDYECGVGPLESQYGIEVYRITVQ